MSKLSIIIVNFNTEKMIIQCIESIYQYPPSIPFEIIVVDNASADKSVEKIINKFPDVIIIINSNNLGFSKANNQGIKIAKNDIVLLLNSDTKILEGALNRLVEFLNCHPDVHVVAPKLLNEDESIQRSYFNFPSALKIFLHITEISKIMLTFINIPIINIILFRINKYNIYSTTYFEKEEYKKVNYVLFACIAIRRKVFERVGLLDEKMYFYHEDCEFSYRLFKKGIEIWLISLSRIVHYGGGSTKNVEEVSFKNYFQSLIYLFRKHFNIWRNIELKAVIFVGFYIRAFLTIFGFYKRYQIPTTYNKIEIQKTKCFPPWQKRFKYYSEIAHYSLINKNMSKKHE